MKFLVQVNSKYKIEHDFGQKIVEMYEKFMEWSPTNFGDWKIELVSIEQLPARCTSIPDISSWTPVGSIPFVSEFVRIVFNDTLPEPLNVPEELMSEYYTGRTCRNIHSCKDAEELLEYVKLHRTTQSTGSKRFFVKSNDIIKDPDNGFYDVIPDNKDGSMTMEARFQACAGGGQTVHKIFKSKAVPFFVGCQVSTVLDEIISEWRVFVYKGKGVGVENYSGDPFKFPNVDRINKFIEAFKSAPEAYTLDVAVTEGGTWVIECHDFFSCGLYGWEDYRNYPYMLNRAWFNIVQENYRNNNDKL